MTRWPEPEAGLVISYAYLWSEEAERGQVEGAKNRPCAIVLAIDDPRTDSGQPKQVVVVPITHSPPRDPGAAIELSPRVKAHLGLDGERSWIILDEVNVFTWPGYDLRPIKDRGGRIDYGFLPPRLFDQMVSRFESLYRKGRVERTARDE